MNDKHLLDYCINHQYNLPRRLYCFAEYYPHVSFYQALELYKISVEEVIILYNAKHLFDEPLSFGRGLVKAKELWLEKMRKAESVKVHSL